MKEEAGKHGFSGSCSPDTGAYSSQSTFSVGIFEWMPKSSGKGFKRSAVKVRIKGFVTDPDGVYRCAEKICRQLDAGEYSGPKNVRVGSC